MIGGGAVTDSIGNRQVQAGVTVNQLRANTTELIEKGDFGP